MKNYLCLLNKIFMNKVFILALIAGFLLTSCVPTRNLVYLQDKDGSLEGQAITPIASKPYRLQTNDIISINIKAIDETLVEIFAANTRQQQTGMQSEQNLYFTGYTVDDHGNIRIPILGEVNVLGYTLEEVRQNIEKRLLDEYFKEEAFLYITVKLAGFRFTVNGEIRGPGQKVLMQEKVNIMEAIASAGDITMVGDRKNVVVVRQYPQGTEIHTIDLTDRNAMKSPYYYLQPNDYIYVKPLPQKSWGTGETGIQSLSTIITVLSLVTSILVFASR
jgi:polysaccharide export outer membrane protein